MEIKTEKFNAIKLVTSIAVIAFSLGAAATGAAVWYEQERAAAREKEHQMDEKMRHLEDELKDIKNEQCRKYREINGNLNDLANDLEAIAKKEVIGKAAKK